MGLGACATAPARKPPQAAFPADFSTLRPFTVSYSPDLSGAVREALQGLGAQVDVQRYQLEASCMPPVCACGRS